MARRRDLADQQQRLSEATWSVLTERGLTGLTIRAVAERAGCTTGLVMHAFPTKEALLLHARDLLHTRTRLRADTVEAEARDGAREVLEGVLLNGSALDAQSADEARVWVSFLAAALTDPQLADRHRAGNRSFVARVTRLLAACRPDRDDAQLGADALSLVALVEGLNTLAAADPATYPPEVQRRLLSASLTRILAEQGGAPDAAAIPTRGPGATAAPTPAGPGAVHATAPSGMRIRSFDPHDTESVVALWAECGLTRPWNDPRRDIARKLTVQPELFLVGEVDGRVVASAMVGYDGHRGWVNYLAVHPGRRGRGDGRALMGVAENLLAERGCPKLNLQIREGNGAVMEFYAALGYTRDGAVGFGKRLIAD